MSWYKWDISSVVAGNWKFRMHFAELQYYCFKLSKLSEGIAYFFPVTLSHQISVLRYLAEVSFFSYLPKTACWWGTWNNSVWVLCRTSVF